MRLLIAILALALPCSAQTVEQVIATSPVISSSGGSVNAGNQFRSAGDDNALLPIASPFVTRSGTYTAGACWVYVGDTSSHTVDCGLYSSSSGAAATRLCHVSKTGTFTAGFSNIGTLSGCGTLAASTLYFSASISSSGLAGTEEGTSSLSCPGGYYSGSPVDGTYGTAQGSAVLPSSFGTNHAVTKCWSSYVALTCVAACGSPVDEYFIINFEAGSNGVAPTTTTFQNSIISSAGGLLVTGVAAARTTFATAGQLHNLLTNLTINGNTVDGSGSLGLAYATGANPYLATINLMGSDAGAGTGGVPSFSIAEWFKTNLPDLDTLGNAYSITTIRSVDTSSVSCNAQILPSGLALTMVLETNAGDATGSITFSSGSTYKIQLDYVTNGTNTTCQMAMYDTSGAQVGSTLSKSVAAANKNAGLLEIGVTGAESESSGYIIWQDDFVGSAYGTWPLSN